MKNYRSMGGMKEFTKGANNNGSGTREEGL